MRAGAFTTSLGQLRSVAASAMHLIDLLDVRRKSAKLLARMSCRGCNRRDQRGVAGRFVAPCSFHSKRRRYAVHAQLDVLPLIDRRRPEPLTAAHRT